MKEFTKASGPIDPYPHFVAASNEIKNFTAILITKEKHVCSGTFANACGHFGILTANHVAELLMKDSEFAICLSETKNRFVLLTANCEHVPIGKWSDTREAEGPDLSFIIFRDPNALATIRSLKSFCYLDTKDLDYFKSPLDQMWWIIAGSPDEAKAMVASENEPTMKLSNFIGFAFFDSREERDGFDFIKLAVPSGEANFPNDFGGMSGGGMWLVPLEADENGENVKHVAPILAGVSFYQSDPDNGERTITGHGFDSIYSRLRQKLKKT